MKLIIKMNDKSARYSYCVYTVFEYEDGNCSEDTRIFETDKVEEFVEYLRLQAQEQE